MKKLITNYTFNAAAKTITFTDYGSIALEGVLLITNVTDNIIIYNFAAAGKGGTVATNVLTLDYDTTSMDNADDLQIFYDDTAVNFATQETLALIKAKTDNLDVALSTRTKPADTQTISGTVTANAGTNLNTSALALESGGNLATIAAKDFATQTTLAAINAKLVSGTDIGDVTINNAAGGSAVNIQDGGNSITVDAPVGTPVFVRLSDGASAISTLPVSLASVPSHPVTNAGTFAVQVDGAALTSLQLIDDVIGTAGSAIPTKGALVYGSDGANARAIKTDTSGELQVDVLSMPTTTVTGTVSANQSGTWNITNISGTISLPTGAATETTLSSLNGKVTACNTGAVVIGSALPAGTNNIGDVDILSIAAGTNYIGKVRLTDGTTDAEIVPLTGYNAAAVAIVDGSGNQITSFGGGTQYADGASAATPTGTQINWNESGTQRAVSATKPLPVDIKNTSVAVTQATASSLNAQAVGNIAHDSADSGNPIKIGGIAKNYGSLPTAVTDADRVNANFDRYGSLFVQIGGSNVGVETVEYSAAQTNTAMITVSAGSAIRVYGFIINISYAVYNAVTLTIGFGTSTTPTTSKCLFRSNGMAPGTYIVQLPAPVVGASDEDLRVTLTDPGASFINITIYRDTVSI